MTLLRLSGYMSKQLTAQEERGDSVTRQGRSEGGGETSLGLRATTWHVCLNMLELSLSNEDLFECILVHVHWNK